MSKLMACMILIAILGAVQTLDTGILGTVTDQGGAVIGAATVTIAQPATGLARSVTTGPEGNYEVRYSSARFQNGAPHREERIQLHNRPLPNNAFARRQLESAGSHSISANFLSRFRFKYRKG